MEPADSVKSLNVTHDPSYLMHRHVAVVVKCTPTISGTPQSLELSLSYPRNDCDGGNCYDQQALGPL